MSTGCPKCSWSLLPSGPVPFPRHRTPQARLNTPPRAGPRGSLVWCLSPQCPQAGQVGFSPTQGPRSGASPAAGPLWGPAGHSPGEQLGAFPRGSSFLLLAAFLWGRPGQRPSLHTASWASSSQARRVPTLQTALTAGKGAAGGQGSPSQLRDCPRLHAGRAPWAWAPRAAAPGGAIRPTPSSLPCCGPGPGPIAR